MEDNKLGDFFRNRINKTIDGNDEWANPFSETDEHILESLSDHSYLQSKIPKPLFSKLLLSVAAVALIVSMIAYLFHLNTQLSNTNQKLESVTKTSASQQKEWHNLIEQQKLTISSKEQEIKNLTIHSNEFQELNDRYRSQRNQLQYIIEQLNSQNNNLSADIQKMKSDAETNKLFGAQNEKTSASLMAATMADTFIEDISSFSILSSLPHVLIHTSDNIEIDFKIASPIRSTAQYDKNFKINYEAQLHTWELPMQWDLEGQKIGSDNVAVNKLNFLTHGLKLQYQFRPNWSLNLGYHYGQINMQSHIDLGLSYSTTSDTLLGSGITNQFKARTQTPLSTTDYTVDIASGNNQELPEGSLVEFRARDNVKLNMFQVPLGITHHFDLDKITLFATTGITLNTFKFTDYKINDVIIRSSEGNPIEVTGYSARYLTPLNNLFFSIHGAAGLSLPIRRAWYMHLAMSNRYNFLSDNKNLSSKRSRHSASWKLGVGYHF